jgi:cell division inhibitor SepF
MGGVMNEAMKLVVIEPASFEESPKLVDSLKSRKPVILNLENLDSETARKIFDFISGATYALNGSVQKVANNIFVFAPENVDISANENREFDFSSMDNNTWR